MLSEAELLDVIRSAAIGRHCRKIDVLPSLTERGLMAALDKPPAVFVSVRDFKMAGDMITVSYSLWIVAQNFRGHQAARQGDGVTMGLYDLAEGVMAAILGTPGYVLGGFRPDNGEYADKFGVHTGEVTCSVTTDLPQDLDLAERLTSFEISHADYDIDPQTPDAHAGWLAEPPITTLGAPDASDTVTLPQEP